ncbi:MAG: diguanylate cyclase domain-containing protein [Oscillospiraceae bacterium]|jgi:diguanylate cyclase (GGDEF)-like protein/PAS domain S-box-containing protein
MFESQNYSIELLTYALSEFFSKTPDIAFVKDNNNRFAAVSQTFASIVGCPDTSEMLGKTAEEVLGVSLEGVWRENEDRELLQGGVPVINRVDSFDRNGVRRYFSISKYTIRGIAGAAIGLLCIGRDITAELELEEERERRSLSTQMFDAVIEADISGDRILRAESSTWQRAIGMLRVMSFSAAVEYVASMFVHEEYSQGFFEDFSARRLVSDFEKGLKQFTILSRMSLDGSKYIWIRITARIHYSKKDGTLRLTCFLLNVDDEIKNREELTAIATTDALTGLLNRRSVMEKIDECISGYGSGLSHALMFIDLDNFKQINDTLGHLLGDRILCEASLRLKSLFRESDIVGRVGGDEFIVLLKNVASRADAEKKARKVFDELTFCYREGDSDINVYCSVGVSMFRGGDKTLEQLYNEADKAMYEAKENGRNCLVFFNE